MEPPLKKDWSTVYLTDSELAIGKSERSALEMTLRGGEGIPPAKAGPTSSTSAIGDTNP